MTLDPEHIATLTLHRPKLFSVASALPCEGGGRKSFDTAFTLPKQLLEFTVKCDSEHKPLVLLHLLTSEDYVEDMKSVLCFTNSKEATHR